jgi:hypothetical protein
LQESFLTEKSWASWSIPVNPAISRSIKENCGQASLGKQQDFISKTTRAKGLGTWLKQ